MGVFASCLPRPLGGGRVLLFESRLVTVDFVPSVLLLYLPSCAGAPQVPSRWFFLRGVTAVSWGVVALTEAGQHPLL